MSSSLVSVIIPHFNRSELLEAAVNSVLCSTHENLEIIVVDDGSSSRERNRIQHLQSRRVRVIDRTDGIKGPSRCRNLGFAASRAEYIVFLDSDDIMAPWCLEQRLKEATARPDAAFWVFPALLFEEIPGDMNVLWNEMQNGYEDAIRFARADPPWHTSSPLWKRASLLAIDGFNEKVYYGDDTDLHLRALASGLIPAQFPLAIPDVFIRRSAVPRITNSLSPDLIESRRTRLAEATGFLKTHPECHQALRAFEGQYIVEAEFLLFNNSGSATPILSVLADWVVAFTPPLWRRWIVRGYFAAALASRDRAPLALRIARRIAMGMLPETFFPRGGQFNQAIAPHATLDIVHTLFRQSSLTIKQEAIRTSPSAS